jgi:hypothetical protein
MKRRLGPPSQAGLSFEPEGPSRLAVDSVDSHIYVASGSPGSAILQSVPVE